MNNTTTGSSGRSAVRGALLAADILARCAMACGDDVKLSEIHGMAQRAGPSRRWCAWERTCAPCGPIKERSTISSPSETARRCNNLDYVKRDGVLITNDESIKPLPADGADRDAARSPQDRAPRLFRPSFSPSRPEARRPSTSFCSGASAISGSERYGRRDQAARSARFKTVNLKAYGCAYMREHGSFGRLRTWVFLRSAYSSKAVGTYLACLSRSAKACVSVRGGTAHRYGDYGIVRFIVDVRQALSVPRADGRGSP